MNVSFTGTRHGMSDWQKQQFRAWVESHKHEIVKFVHGVCVGADIEAHKIVREVCGGNVFIVCFPSNVRTRAPIPLDTDWVAAPKASLERNKDIVNMGHDVLVAAPQQDFEILRSGTWAAIRYAKSKKVPVIKLLR